MATVIDENTGEEVEVQPVEAALTISTTGGFNSEFPASAGRVIEEAMAGAIRNAMEEGITDPDVLRQHALDAREAAKVLLRQQQSS
jgi:hypothetical protein